MAIIRFLKQASQHGAFAGDEMEFDDALVAELVASGTAELVPLTKEEEKEAKAAAKAEAKEAKEAAKDEAKVEAKEAAKEEPAKAPEPKQPDPGPRHVSGSKP